MAALCKAVAGGLLLTLSLSLLRRGAEGQENGPEKKVVPGGAVIYLGQDRDTWTPLIHTAVNLSDIASIRSVFQLRTFDPEGAILYGDTKKGVDWFVLSLKDGVPLMQLCKGGTSVSVAGGAQLNDGKWHTLEVSNHGTFVFLDVDGSRSLVVGMQSKLIQREVTGELRLALGGILIDDGHMVVQFDPLLDGCIREGNWLNLTAPWDAEVDELWPCDQNVQPGSYFPGTGFAIFNTSVFPVETDRGVEVGLWGDFAKMDGTILSVKAAGQQPVVALAAHNDTKEVAFGGRKFQMKDTLRRLVVTFRTDSLEMLLDEGGSNTTIISISSGGDADLWSEGRLAFGCLLGDGEENACSQFLTGCLTKIQVQGKDLDLDLAGKHKSISSHSCPA